MRAKLATETTAVHSPTLLDKRPLLSHLHVRSLGIASLGIAGWAATRPAQDDPTNYVAFALMAIAALLPALLWAIDPQTIRDSAFFALCRQLCLELGNAPLDRHPLITLYEPTERVYAATVVVVHLLAGLVGWRLIWRKPPKPPRQIWVLKSGTRLSVYFVLLIASIVYEFMFRAGQLNEISGLLPITRAFFGSVSMIALLMLAFRIGRGEGEIIHRLVFFTLLIIFCLINATGLLLVGAIVALGAATFGLTLGSGKLPWKMLSITIAIMAVLHLGKEQMRDYHWNYLGRWTLTISEYPEFYRQWLEYGVDRLMMDDEQAAFQSARSVVQRASLFHMTLRTTQMAGADVPYLLGESYAPVPLLLVPRFIAPDKPFSHEGTTLLNVHYGLQDREGTETTTIGWGLMNESYANFGIFGAALLGLLLGWVIGFIERLGKDMPLESMRVLYGFFFVGIAINTEATMGVFLTTWFQGSVGLAMLLAYVDRRKFAAT
ncbi:MAG: hypothetical protein IPK97_06870 [Ahniella sp.]|nr:hypothetical protein [Ahniella sp.]